MVNPTESRIKADNTPLGSVPDALKTQILNCLGVKDAAKVSVINALWQDFVSKPLFWQQVAKKMNIQVQNSANIKNEVLDFCRYHEMNDLFKNFLPRPIQEGMQKCKFESEKYKVLVNYLRSDPRPNPLWNFLYDLGPHPTPIQLQTAKQLIKDDAFPIGGFFYQECLKRTLGKTDLEYCNDEHANLEVFKILVAKAKDLGFLETMQTHLIAEIVRDALSLGANKDFLKVLLEAGGKIYSETLDDAARNEDTLKFLLDYADNETRSEAIDKLNDEEARCEAEELLGITQESIAASYNAKRKIITDAPPPTYGGDEKRQKSGG